MMQDILEKRFPKRSTESDSAGACLLRALSDPTMARQVFERAFPGVELHTILASVVANHFGWSLPARGNVMSSGYVTPTDTRCLLAAAEAVISLSKVTPDSRIAASKLLVQYQDDLINNKYSKTKELEKVDEFQAKIIELTRGVKS